ncbi:hypothetical protein B1748_11970 [Paenibacillus sp. MY03]|uniref:alpha/beta hydrolase family protein n=1 Tax=Paenibacillus sp. MY03 TaxID=302980 RepID=UPI000B3C4105|nr:prolyl oligopeptidase family serine peptidase [Paenibacillus sp. MY03]OUS76396.1 hypothetical protein B1748_11970 [Paenibacillus sp. MY03]
MIRFEQYEDRERLKRHGLPQSFKSPYQDFCIYTSSISPGVRLGMNVIKPPQAGPMLVQLHGWHMSMPKPAYRERPSDLPYLIVQVDMRGRAFSEGAADCNGYELIDIYDAIHFVRKEYAEWLDDSGHIYLEGGSGGGGNVLAAVAKFPDLFSAAAALYGISDYASWYEQDATGEFRDEMDVWVGCSPEADLERYRARSGIALAANVVTPLYMAHGDRDIRVPVEHSREYVREMRRLGRQSLIVYEELPGVGGRGHLTNMTEEQAVFMGAAVENHRREQGRKPVLPAEGGLIVGGYVYTKPFRLLLETVNGMASLTYDLKRRIVRASASAPYRYELIWEDGQVEKGVCEVR